MKVAVLSDIHDHIWNLDKTLKLIRDQRCDQIIFCGDMCAPFTVQILSTSKLPIQAVFGNNDGDQVNLIKSSQGRIQYTLNTEEYGVLEKYGVKIGFVHYPKLAESLLRSGQFNAVFYGHTHVKFLHTSSVILCNPGSVCGIVSGKPSVASFAIFDTQSKQVQFIDL